MVEKLPPQVGFEEGGGSLHEGLERFGVVEAVAAVVDDQLRCRAGLGEGEGYPPSSAPSAS
jgi:hypothetical protein